MHRVDDAAIGVIDFKAEGSAEFDTIDQASDVYGGAEGSGDASGIWKDVSVGISRIWEDEESSAPLGNRDSGEVDIEILNNYSETILSVPVGFLTDEEVGFENNFSDRDVSSNRCELKEWTAFDPSRGSIIEDDWCSSGIDADDDLIGGDTDRAEVERSPECELTGDSLLSDEEGSVDIGEFS